MFSETTSNQIGVPSGFGRDTKLSDLMLRLAKRRQDRSATSDVHAAFKEGERSPIREAAAA